MRLSAILLCATFVAPFAPAAKAGDGANVAEDLFRAMESRLLTSEAVELTVTSSFPGATVRGTMALAHGNRLNADLEVIVLDQSRSFAFICDGTYCKGRDVGSRTPGEIDAPVALDANMRRYLARIGLFYVSPYSLASPLGASPDLDFAVELGLSDFRLGPAELIGARAAQRIDYVLTFAGTGPQQASLWLDATTGLPLRRDRVLGSSDGAVHIVDDYAFVLRDVAERSRFVIPDPSPRPRWKLAGDWHGVHVLAWSPDGASLAAAIGGDSFGGKSSNGPAVIRIWDATTWAERHVLYGHGRPIGALAFSPDGLVLASGDSGGAIVLWDPPTGRALATIDEHTNNIGSLAWNPAGDTLASASWDGTMRLWDERGQAMKTVATGPQPVYAVAWDADGKQLIATLGDGDLDEVRMVLWGAEDARAKTSWTGRADFGQILAVTPGGATFVTGMNDAVELREIDRPTSSRVLSSLSVASLAYRPDGRFLAAGLFRDGATILDPRTGERLHELRRQGGMASALAWSGDGKFLAVSNYRDIRIWDTTELNLGD